MHRYVAGSGHCRDPHRNRARQAAAFDSTSASGGQRGDSAAKKNLAGRRCARRLARLACSRPVAEAKWMEHERYVGISTRCSNLNCIWRWGSPGRISSTWSAPTARGQFRHQQKIKNAPIFQYADFGIVGDALNPACVDGCLSAINHFGQDARYPAADRYGCRRYL